MAEPAKPDHRVADQPAAAVAGAGDLSGVINADPGSQVIGEAEPVRGAQGLEVVDLSWGRVIVTGETALERLLVGSGHGLRRDPGQRRNAGFVSHVSTVPQPWWCGPPCCPVPYGSACTTIARIPA